MLHPRKLILATLAVGLLAGCDIHLDGATTPDVVMVGDNGNGESGWGGDYNPQPVYSYGPSAVANPVIQSLTSNPTSQVPKGQPITFQVVAHDPNGELLQYNWSATGGTLSTTSGIVVSWNPPANAGVYSVTVTITNQDGGLAAGTLNLTVQADGASQVGVAPPSSAPSATPAPTAPPATPSPTPTPAATPSPVPLPVPTATPSPVAGKANFYGWVKDTSGNLLTGATVTATSTDPTQTIDVTATTDVTGRYVLTGIPGTSQLQLTATATGYQPQSYKVVPAQGVYTQVNFDGALALSH